VANKGQDTSDRRMTKAERKEAARLEREALQRKIAQRKRTRKVVIVASIVVVALVAGAVVLFAPRSKGLPTAAELIKAAPAEAQAAGCGPVETIKPYGNVPATSKDSQDRTHIGTTPAVPTPPPLTSYSSVPPVSGPHDPTPWNAGVFGTPPPIYQAIHSLEHAAVEIWYDPTASGEQLDQIKAFFRKPANSTKVIVAPYSYPNEGSAGQLKPGSQMVLAAWHHMQSCSEPNLAAAYDFVAKYRFPASSGQKYLGEAPEPNVAI